ncbi:5-deoxy-glucuronate isomerase [Desulfurella amilsii]|uniref:5-deoxy-glucuronate isomerase n=1 Tax=Desulfurella amilsii TaxID=1562698 RepID=A0A1X4XUH9_9BACT|nr:5-deoxy-glucuronate isomerase [Desulfurella amilsii]OSS41182.1 5-deoxy-glucuronate isomerase [Desulfurella amilsii]
MQLKIKHSYDASGAVKNIYLSHLKISGQFEVFDERCETAVILLSGAVEVFWGEKYLLQRKNVFEEKASAIYVPRNTKISLFANKESEIAVCKTMVSNDSKLSIILPSNIKEQLRGNEGFKRKVYDILDENSPSLKLVVGETINFKGEWSSFPPHKHDENTAKEVKMEEIYLFKLNPDDGFGLQRIYTEDKVLDEALVVESNDIVLIPKGYHPVCVIPGYELYYLWVLVGDSKKLMPNTQEKYKWLIK